MNNNSQIKILIVGTGSLLNYGCEAIVQGTYNILKKFLPNCQIYVASDNHSYDRGVLPGDIILINYRRRFSPYRIWKGVLRRFFNIGNGSDVRMNYNVGKKYDIVLSCGGDNYCENPSQGLYNIILDLMNIGEVATKHNNKYVLWGASVGAFLNKQNYEKVISNLALCELITVRELLSYKYLLDDGKLNNVTLVADPAFCMNIDESVVLDKEPNCVYIGFNFSTLAVGHSNLDDKFIINIYNTLDAILNKHDNYRIVCIPHVVSSQSGPQNDREFLNNYIQHTAFKDRISILPENIGAKRTKGYIKQLDFLIASRMHCCVGGISSATPTLFVTYSNKGKGMSYYAYGNNDYDIECKDVNDKQFVNLVDRMIEKRTEIREYLKQQHSRFYDDAMLAGSKLLEVIENK